MPHLRGQTGGNRQETAARTASTTRTSRRRLRADAPAMLSIQFLRIYGPSQVAVVSPSTPHGCMLSMTRAKAATQTRLRRGGCSLDGPCVFAPIAVVLCTPRSTSVLLALSARPHHCAGAGGAGVRRYISSPSASLASRYVPGPLRGRPSYPPSFCPSST
jgi:hypothetical protein